MEKDMPATLSEILLAVAGCGSLAAAIAHSVLGERLFIPQIQTQTTWPGSAKAAAFRSSIVRLAWHVTSVMWLGFAALLLAPLLGFDGLMPVYVVAAATFGVVLVMTGPMTAFRHVGWPVFAVITASLVAALALA
jgi:hypothetical protein